MSEIKDIDEIKRKVEKMFIELSPESKVANYLFLILMGMTRLESDGQRADIIKAALDYWRAESIFHFLREVTKDFELVGGPKDTDAHTELVGRLVVSLRRDVMPERERASEQMNNLTELFKNTGIKVEVDSNAFAVAFPEAK